MLHNQPELVARWQLLHTFSFSDLTFHFFSTGVVYCRSDTLFSYRWYLVQKRAYPTFSVRQALHLKCYHTFMKVNARLTLYAFYHGSVSNSSSVGKLANWYSRIIESDAYSCQTVVCHSSCGGVWHLGSVGSGNRGELLD